VIGDSCLLRIISRKNQRFVGKEDSRDYPIVDSTTESSGIIPSPPRRAEGEVVSNEEASSAILKITGANRTSPSEANDGR
jgi:hypothetical protein